MPTLYQYKHEGRNVSVGELRSQQSELFAGKSDAGRRQLMWEKLWTTTNRDYGRFSNMKGRQHTNQRRGEVFKPTTWDTTGREIGAKTVAKPATAASQPPASPQKFSRHLAPEVLKLDDVTKCDEAKSNVTSPQRSPIPASHPRPHLLPARESYSVKRGWGQKVTTSDEAPRAQRIATSGLAKQYITTTQGPFWKALPSAQV